MDYERINIVMSSQTPQTSSQFVRWTGDGSMEATGLPPEHRGELRTLVQSNVDGKTTELKNMTNHTLCSVFG